MDATTFWQRKRESSKDFVEMHAHCYSNSFPRSIRATTPFSRVHATNTHSSSENSFTGIGWVFILLHPQLASRRKKGVQFKGENEHHTY
jgi:hypothetical protein